MRTQTETLLVVAALLGISAAPARGQDTAIDPRWLAYLGCWEQVASGRAIATAPASTGQIFEAAVPGLVAIPLSDARPTVLSLVWHKGNPNPLVDLIVAIARRLVPAAELVTRESSA